MRNIFVGEWRGRSFKRRFCIWQPGVETTYIPWRSFPSLFSQNLCSRKDDLYVAQNRVPNISDVSGGYGHKSRIETDLYVFNTTESNFETLIDVHHPNSANISNMVLDAQNSSPLAIISDDGLKGL